MIPVQQFTFTIAAGGSFPQQCDGRYFRIQAASGTMKVVGDSFGNMGSVGVGQGLHLKATDEPFHRLTFIDTSGSPNTVTVVIADADFVDNSLLGTVSVIDGEKTRTLAGGMFSGSPAIGPTVGQYQFVQLWNPAGSGKNLIVTQVQANGTGNHIFVWKNAAIANLYGPAPANKRADGGGPIGQLRTESNVAPDPLTKIIYNGTAPYLWQIRGALVVPPGYGLVDFNNVQNSGAGMNVEWFEESQ